MAKVALVSACLVGLPVAYDGRHRFNSRVVDILKSYDELLIMCPEKDLFGVPRPPMELTGGDGSDFLDGRAGLVAKTGMLQGERVTPYLNRLLEIVSLKGAYIAILKNKSPFCGVDKIYDGTFSDRLIEGRGIMAALLSREGFELLGVD